MTQAGNGSRKKGQPGSRKVCFGIRPLTLYSEGSCFELNGEVADIENFSAFANTGLPVLREDQNDQLNVETDWKSCLYLPQNGYGEISVNPDFLVQS